MLVLGSRETMAQLRVCYRELGFREIEGTIGDVIKERDEFVFTKGFRWERGPPERLYLGLLFPLPLHIRRRTFCLLGVALGIRLNTVVLISDLECLSNGTLSIIRCRVERDPAIIVVARARPFENLNDLVLDQFL